MFVKLKKNLNPLAKKIQVYKDPSRGLVALGLLMFNVNDYTRIARELLANCSRISQVKHKKEHALKCVYISKYASSRCNLN